MISRTYGIKGQIVSSMGITWMCLKMRNSSTWLFVIGNMMINHWILRTLFSDKPNISIYPYAKWFNTHGFKTLERCGRLNQDSSGLYRSCLQHGDPVAWPRCEDHLQCSVPCTVCCVKVPEICTIRAYKSPQPWENSWKNPWKTHRFKDLAGDLLSECRTQFIVRSNFEIYRKLGIISHVVHGKPWWGAWVPFQQGGLRWDTRRALGLGATGSVSWLKNV